MHSELPTAPGAADAPTGDAGRPATEAVSASTTPEAVAPLAPLEAPPRAVWTSLAPAVPWCPAEWIGHLEAVAPGLATAVATTEAGEAVGDRLAAHGWTLVMASRRGRLHAHRGDHREDAGAISGMPSGWCAAVADGAGSAAWSRLGAAMATHVFTHAVRAELATGGRAGDTLATAMQRAADATNRALRDFASRSGLALRDLRTTLLSVALHQGSLAVMQVGDGAMALLHTGRVVIHPHAAATGDYSGEVTHFLPDDGAVEHLRQSLAVRDADDCVGVVLATDGVDDPYYPFTRHVGSLYAQLLHGTTAETPLPAGLVPVRQAPVFDAPDPVRALSEWLAFEKRGENDDRTLCVIRRDGTSW
ncbi:MAG: protein phosphatase 2C domain-containing protein [Gemmatimonas sp.]|uniref:PP2C family serine/threonine-protein phosphatase n=1 Tax=Gemmatimonas sp. TaxID=1962908 RepID=UPI00391F58D3|nr:protein phosphatase 2C domain-containing protein [Gemmatimonadota bacterium]